MMCEIITCMFEYSVGRWSTHWFKLELEIPEGWIGEEVRLIWDSTSEAMVWKNGEPLQVVFLQCVSLREFTDENLNGIRL